MQQAPLVPEDPLMQQPVMSSLLLLLDSRSPAGGHSHSGGMEAAVAAGYVNNLAELRDFCDGRLHTAGRVAAAFAAAACRGWAAGWKDQQWLDLDDEFSARVPSEFTRAASRSLGSGLRRLLRATAPDAAAAIEDRWALCSPPAPHHALVLGAGVAITGGDPAMAARAAALGSCTAPASAAVRLLGLDPYAVHGIVAGMSNAIELVVMQTLAAEQLPALSAPAMDLLADVHARSEVRLFAS